MARKNGRRYKRKEKVEDDATTVAFDSDDEPPAETSHDRMFWRQDPDESKSDWTIHIVVQTSNVDEGGANGGAENDVQTYHVHRHSLTVGPRRSEYFVRLLQDGGRFAESQSQTSRIQLNEIAARAFPLLLDFIYSSERDDPLPLSADNATALYSLAKYFDIRRLRYLTKQFWKVDVLSSVEASETYYEHATILQEDKVLQAATESGIQWIFKISPSSRLLNSTYTKFWLDLEMHFTDDEASANSTDHSLHISWLLAYFFQNNHHAEPEIFKKLTTEAFLPHIHKDAAIPLLDAERRILNASNNNSTLLTNLQERCIQSITENWWELDLGENSPTVQLLYQQSPLILGRLFAATVSRAQKDYERKLVRGLSKKLFL